jgi:hypothetical protein
VARPALEVADIFRDHGAAWRAANAGHVSLDQLKVMSAIERCGALLRVSVDVGFAGWTLHCVAERANATRNDRNLVYGIGSLQRGGHQRMAHLVMGNNAAFFGVQEP